MKTAVSIPYDVFEAAEHFARNTRRSRSRLFSDALREYLAHRSPDKVNKAMKKACSEIGAGEDLFVSTSSRRVLQRSQW